MARVVHNAGMYGSPLIGGVLMSLGLTIASCVVPQDIRAPEDHAPRIELRLTTPIPRDLLTPDRSADRENFRVTVTDPDDQVLRARAFIDGKYDQQIEISNDVIPPPADGNDPRFNLRIFHFDIIGLCDEKVDGVAGRYVLELYISDNGFTDSGFDLRVALPGGFRDIVMWRFNCIEPGSSSAGQ